jgi:GalNAc-alpha-(1->4)-GalNAc-alpha-(1->3)-diNAcBac-PP-undecaprenol alpha-1,4-N-acetyl-D-galactosaminyltransferase
MRITLVINTLGGGGAERMATIMVNYWAAKGWEVTILTTDFAGEPSCYSLHPRVKHLDLGNQPPGSLPIDPRVIKSLSGLIGECSESERAVLPPMAETLKLRGAILNTAPDVVISYLDRTNMCVLLATLGVGLPVIVSEQCDPNENPIGAGWELLRRRLYPLASYVTVLTEESLDYFSSVSGIRGRIIPNAVTPDVVSRFAETPQHKNGKTLLAMGRLDHQKGFDLLVSAFAIIAKMHPDWTLLILGEGVARAYLESCVQKHGLGERVRMPGFTKRPFDAMRRADLFVLSSLDEGFGNVLIEAMACSVAVVSFDCPSGPRHIIRDGIDGVLVPPRDAQAMAAALDLLMGDEAARRRLAEKGPEVVERFGVEKVMSMWEELVLDCRSKPYKLN